MSLNALVPIVAAVFCFEIASIFAVLYLKVGRRPPYLVFTGMALMLSLMTMASFLTAWHQRQPSELFWLRMQYAAAAGAFTLFLHFSALVTGEPFRRSTTWLTYLFGGALMALSTTDLFLRPATAPSGWVFEAGRLYLVMAPLMMSVAFLAWLRLMLAARRRHQQTFAPIEAHLPTILFGSGLVIFAGGVVVAIVIFFPAVKLPVSPHSLAAVVFCMLTAVALAKELLRSESEKLRLAQLVHFRDQAVRDLAHDLKNPLAGVQTTMSVLLSDIVDESTRQEMLTICGETCTRLMRLLNNMLDTARLEAGRELELRPEKLDVAALAQHVVNAQRLTSTDHSVTLSADLPRTTYTLDGDKVYQVLTNLVHNAIKYSPEGGHVKVEVAEADGQVRFAVADEGIGMTPSQVERLFRAFERVIDPERRITGTGIGLHMVKRLVEFMGGRIAVDSVAGHGSTFTVWLPEVA